MSIKIALAGNPNCGKTTLFNGLAGSNQFVGNWSGVTVEKKESKLKGNKDVIITDPPGIYLLSPYVLEEVVVRNYPITECPNAILSIVNGANLEWSLYLTTQLTELGIPMLMAVNTMNVAKKSGSQTNIQVLSRELDCPVVKISASRGTGIVETANRAVELARDGRATAAVYEPFADVGAALEEIERCTGGNVPEMQKRFYAIKLFEQDDKIAVQMTMAPDVGSTIACMEDVMDDDAESIVTNKCYTYTISIIGRCCTRRSREKVSVSDKTDHIVTNRFLALPIFAAVVRVVYYVSATTVGTWATGWANDGVFGEGWSLLGLEVPGAPAIMKGFLMAVGCADWLSSLILGGIVADVGAVLGFVPQILVLFIPPTSPESCGYMARVVFIMDRIFRKFGLSGKSFIPMLIGTGCDVPGIIASRIIKNDGDRKMAIMTTTFIPCGAKLPIIALLAGALFGGASWVVPGAYFVGIATIICSGIILKKTKASAGDPALSVMEFPAHHLPTMSNVLRSMWERGWSFIKKAGTIILLSTIFVWFTSGSGFVNGRFGMVEDLLDGTLTLIGQVIVRIFAPLGWGNWQAAVAAIAGLVAKEDVVGVSGIPYGFVEMAEGGAEIQETLAQSSTAISVYFFPVSNLLCVPCSAVMGVTKREMNNARWTWFAIGYQTVLAYAVALRIYRFGSWSTTGTFGIGTAAAIAAVIGSIYLLARSYKESNSLNMNAKAKTVSQQP